MSGDVSLAKEIFKQAGLEVKVKAKTTIVDATLLDIDDSGATPSAEEQTLLALNRSGINTDINVYYINKFTSSAQGRTIPESQWADEGCIVTGVLTATTVLAHEIGHMLGLFHHTDSDNVMYEGWGGCCNTDLKDSQISTILASDYVVEE